MTKKCEAVDRYSVWTGRKTHTDYIENGKIVGRSVDRSKTFSGEYSHTDHYTKGWNKTGGSKR